MKLHTEKFDKLVIAVITFSFILRVYLSLVSVPLNGVETVHPNIVRYMAETKSIPVFTPLPPTADLFHYTPLFHIIASSLYSIFINISYFAAEFSMKLISPIFALLTMILIYLISIRLFYSKKVGFYSVLFFAFLPLSITMSTYITLDNEFAFFILLSFYFLITNHFILSSLSFALAYNSKVIALFYSPFIIYALYLRYRTNNYLKKILLFLLIALILIAPWMIRNAVTLHNPAYPLLNNIFHGYKYEILDDTFNRGGNVYNFFSKNFLAKFFFGLFGIPEENKDIKFTYYGISSDSIKDITDLDFPLIVATFNLWIFAIIIFSIPIFLGFYYLYKNKNKFSLYVIAIIISGTILHVLYIFLAGDTATRYYSPLLPFLAILWAYGFVNHIQKPIFQLNFVKTFGKFFLVGMLLGFIATEIYKVELLSFGVHKYDPLFKWINIYIPDEAYIYKVSSVITYYTNNYYTDSIEKLLETKGYIITQDPGQTYGPPLYVPSKIPTNIEGYKEIYSDEESRIKIYKIV